MRVLAFVAAACLLATPVEAADLDSAVVGKWLALEIRGEPVNTEPRPWVQFDASGRAGGHDGCNDFGVIIALGNGRVRTEPWSLIQTLMGCIGHKEAFTANLMTAKSYEVTADELNFADEAGKPVLRLQRAP